MTEKTITQYIAEDGIIFLSEESCLKYEKFLLTDLNEVKRYINDFLINTSNYESWVSFKEGEEGHITCSSVYLELLSINDYGIGIKLVDENSEELDENFCVDDTKWEAFEKEFENKFGVELYIPFWYWVK